MHIYVTQGLHYISQYFKWKENCTIELADISNGELYRRLASGDGPLGNK